MIAGPALTKDQSDRLQGKWNGDVAIAVAARDVDGPGHEPETIHDRRQYACGEQAGDRHVADDPDQDEIVGRRNQRAGAACGSEQRGAERRRVTLLLERRVRHLADGGGIGRRRARDAAEQHRRGDHRHAQPAAPAADGRRRQIHQIFCDAAFGQQCAGENEQRNGQEVEGTERVVHLLRQSRQQHEAMRSEKQADQSRGAENKRNGYPDSHEDDKGDTQNDACASHDRSMRRRHGCYGRGRRGIGRRWWDFAPQFAVDFFLSRLNDAEHPAGPEREEGVRHFENVNHHDHCDADRNPSHRGSRRLISVAMEY